MYNECIDLISQCCNLICEGSQRSICLFVSCNGAFHRCGSNVDLPVYYGLVLTLSQWMHTTLTLHALLHKNCTLLTCWHVISLTSINVHQQFDLHGSRPDQNGAASPSVTARVSERFHGYFGGEGAAEFLGRSESEAEAHKELRSSIRTCNWYDNCFFDIFLTVVNLFSFCAFFV